MRRLRYSGGGDVPGPGECRKYGVHPAGVLLRRTARIPARVQYALWLLVALRLLLPLEIGVPVTWVAASIPNAPERAEALPAVEQRRALTAAYGIGLNASDQM